MKLIKKFISFVISLVVILCIAVVGVYFYVRSTYDIDLIDTVSELKKLGEEVDESEICPNAFSDDNMLDMSAEINKSAENFITYSEENGYTVNFDGMAAKMRDVIKLTDKQVGALAQTVVEQEMDGKVQIAGKEIGLALKQVAFSDIEDGNVTFNAVLQLDITAIKNEMNGFPFNYLKQYVPDYFYVSSTVFGEKGETEFTYTVAHKALTVNNLSADETEDLFRTLDLVLNIGTAAELNELIGNTLFDALVGSETQNGLAYSMKKIGATDCTFMMYDDIGYFVVTRW